LHAADTSKVEIRKEYTMSPLKTVPAIICLIFLLLPAEAGIRSAGKYSGVVVFDRWDGCILYSGIYVMYISEQTKEKLRKFSGKSIQIDAKKVSQPINPGDGLISELTFLRAPPLTARNRVSVSDLTLRAQADFKEGEKPSVFISLANIGKEEVKIFGSELAPTLLMKAAKPDVADGPSFALVTRQAFISGGEELRTTSSGVANGRPYGWQIDKAVPVTFVLKSGEERRVRITFDLPAGEYDFLAGYGGGVHEDQGLASNLIAFDVGDNGGKLVKVKRK
jgi:hypothetical protein